MNIPITLQLETAFSELETRLDSIIAEYRKNDEFVIIPNFLPEPLIEIMKKEAFNLNANIHRSFIPKHKKGGSVSRRTIYEKTDIFKKLYESINFREILGKITNEELKMCPENDQHGCALYYYNEEGDFIGYHFDTSYYIGNRYTLLIGIVDESSCYLEYELFHKSKYSEIIRNKTKVDPGSLVLFNGDKLRHRITPTKKDELRIVLTLEYVSNTAMNPFLKFVSNMKDSIAYFGFRNVFQTRKR